jgi:hypothetical protein
MSTSTHRPPSLRDQAWRLGVPAALLALIVGLGLVAGGAGAATASRTTVVLGETSSTPDPSCPESPCQAIGSVTGFQVSTDQESLPFRVPRDGRVKSWTLALSQPNNMQRSFFNNFFGTPPEARLAILRRVPGTSPPRYVLRKQGPVEVLSQLLGRTPRFTVSIPVRKNDIIGITVPTWAPAFAEELSSKNSWRASREPGSCTDTTAVRQGLPQQRVGRRATYGCRYSTARLLYTATVVMP